MFRRSASSPPPWPKGNPMDEPKTIGERIAGEFDRDKVALTPAEQRRLATMIDAKVGPLKRAMQEVQNCTGTDCNLCKDVIESAIAAAEAD